MTQLSKNFTLQELTASSTAKAKGIDNSLPPELLGNIKELAFILQMIRDSIGKPIRVTSGYRSPRLNAAVGGSNTSAHSKGLAADITVAGMSAMELAKHIEGMNIPFDQLILEYPDKPNQWVHIGLSERANRHQVLTKKTGTGYMVGLVA